MPTIETLQSQAKRLNFSEGEDFQVTPYTSRTTGHQTMVLELTPAGRLKRQQLTESLFNSETAPTYSIPLPKTMDVSQLHEGDILVLDGLLALSLIRRRTGGYVCTFTDDFHSLEQENYKARIIGINSDKATVRIMFDHWPGEYLSYDYLLEKPNLTSINEPISIGPECTIQFQVLKDNRPHEDLVGWAKNVIRRNLLGKK